MANELRLPPGWDEHRFRSDVRAMGSRLEALAASGGHAVEELATELGTAYEELRVADEEIRAQSDHIERLLAGNMGLASQQERLVALVQVPVLTTDRFGVVRSANAAAAALLGDSPPRLTGKPLASFVPAGHRRSLRDLLSDPGRGAASPRALAVLSRTRPDSPVEVVVTLFAGRTGEIVWVLRPGPGPTGREVGTRLPQALVELADLVARGPGEEQVVHGVAGILQSALGPGTAVSACLGDPLGPDQVASGSARAQQLDGAELAAGQGPGTDAYRSGAVVVSHDVAADERWPRLGAHLRGAGVAVVAAPLVVGVDVAGATTAWIERGPDLEACQEAVGLLASAAGSALQEVRTREELRGLAEQLRAALESRAVIDQAKGIVMADRRCGPDEAFAHLVSLSSSRHVKLRVLAQEIVQRAGGRSGGTGEGPWVSS